MNSDQNSNLEIKEEENPKETDPTDEKSITKILRFEDFLLYMKKGLNIHEITFGIGKQMRYLFDGIDIEGLSYVNSRDADYLLLCFIQNDWVNITKLFFCGADQNRDRKINISSIGDAVNNLCSQKMNKEQFELKCRSKYGENKKELKFFEFYKILTDKDIDKNYDPYEGRVREKSACCLLI